MNKQMKETREEEVLPWRKMPTDKYRRNEGIRKPPLATSVVIVVSSKNDS